ncbi:MAG: molybdopterin-dependent oxidoreductase [Acidimicrobiales bacterium]
MTNAATDTATDTAATETATGTEPAATTKAYRTCPLCEAGCGLEITLTDGRPTLVRGDRDDVFSKGYLCPKGSAIAKLHDDPDWLRAPMVKRNGEFVEVSWDEAFSAIADGLLPVLAEHGRDACAMYLGNPGAHSIAPLLYNRTLIKAVGTANLFSASTVDQRPKEISAGLMFGSVTVPVPDLDRTDFLLLLGANPYASNGSLCTAPDFPGRLERLQERGGRYVVVDPRRSETAAKADQHLAIRPGTDAHLLAAIANTLIVEGLADTERLAPYCNGLDRLPTLLAGYTPESVAPTVGVDADVIRTLTHDLANAPTAAVYGRIGTCTQEFGTLASWLVDVVNLLSGNLDRVGGAMFTKGATGQPSTKGAPRFGRGLSLGRSVSRVGKWPKAFGEFPVSALPEEIETPGEGQVRAMIVVGGNPVSSNPNFGRLDAAIASLDFMVAIDPYINETTRHADVILPPPSALQKSHYDLALLNFAVHNVANYSAAVLALPEGQLSEWEIMLRLAAVLAGQPPAGDDVDNLVAEMDRAMAAGMLASATRDTHGKVHGREVEELMAMVVDANGTPRVGPERLLDILLRTGPYGDGFGSEPDGLTLAVLEASPHGVDLGELEGDRLPDLLRTPSGLVEVVPDVLADDLARLASSLERDWTESMVLVGRRHLRSNNSWMHNIRVLTKGKNRCTLQLHPDDAERLGILDGAMARVSSRVGEVSLTAELTDGIRPGVVSIPHGFGQNLPDVQLAVASDYAGVNTNVLTDEYLLDPVSGNVALNGVPVQVSAVI